MTLASLSSRYGRMGYVSCAITCGSPHSSLASSRCFALLLRKNQARIRYWLWMAASAKFTDSLLAADQPGKPSALVQLCGGAEDKCLRRNRRDEPAIPGGAGPQYNSCHSRCAAGCSPGCGSYPPDDAHGGLAEWLHHDDELLVCAVAANLQISAVGKALNRGTRG